MKRSLMVLVLTLGLVAAACAGEDDASSGVASLTASDTSVGASGDETGDTDGTEVDAEQAMLDFAACMRDNGIEIEDPTVDADGNVQFGSFRGPGGEAPEIDREVIEAARTVCEEEIEGIALGFGGRSDFDLTEMQDTFVEYAACMRDNGYDMDDPDLSNFGPGSGNGPGEGGGIFGEIDREDPDYIAAQSVCEEILTGAFGDAPIPGTGQGRGGGGG